MVMTEKTEVGMLSNIKFVNREINNNQNDTIGLTYSFMNWGAIKDTIIINKNDVLDLCFGDVEDINRVSYLNIKAYLENNQTLSVVRACPTICNPQWASNYIKSADISHACLFVGKSTHTTPKRWHKTNNGEDLFLKLNDYTESRTFPLFETEYPLFVYGKYAGSFANKFKVSIVSWRENLFTTMIFGNPLNYYLSRQLNFGEYLVVVNNNTTVLEYFIISFISGSSNHIFKIVSKYVGFEVDENYTHPTLAEYEAGNTGYLSTIIEKPLLDGYCVYDNSAKINSYDSPVLLSMCELTVTDAYVIFFDILSKEELDLAKTLSMIKGKMVVGSFHPLLTTNYSEYPTVFEGIYTFEPFEKQNYDITLIYGYCTKRHNGQFLITSMSGDVASSLVGRLGSSQAVEMSEIQINSSALSIFELANEQITETKNLNMIYIRRVAQTLYIEGNKVLSGRDLNTKYLSIQFVNLINEYVYSVFEGENLQDSRSKEKINTIKKVLNDYFADITSDLKVNINIDDINYKFALVVEVSLNDYIDVFNIVVIR
jgi:hypothetical protein